MAHFIGMDFIFAEREYCQTIQSDNQGCKVLVNSTRRGDLLSVRPVPKHLAEKVWFTRKLRFPRQYLGITKMDERVSHLSYLVHVLTQHGFTSRAVAKSVYRLTLTWMYSKYEDMRKHVSSITRRVIASLEKSRKPWMPKKGLSQYPCFHGEKRHENGITVPLWNRPQPVKGGH